MSDPGLGAGLSGPAVRRLEGRLRPLRLRLAVGRQRPLPRLRAKASVRRGASGGPDVVPVPEPDRLPKSRHQIWSVLL